MHTVRPLHILCLAVALTSVPAAATGGPPTETRPIEGFVAPAHLFPMEGTAFMDETGKSVPYAPLTAWSDPGGARVGEIRMSRPECVARHELKECDRPPEWLLHTSAGVSHALPTREFRYEGEGLVTYRAPVRKDAAVWSAIEYAGGVVWVSTPAAAVFPYESLATVIGGLDRWCPRPGECSAPTAAMRTEMAKVANGEFRLAGCYPHAYTIEGVLSHQGQRYYKATLVEVEPGTRQPMLPKIGFVPVRRQDGSHSGTFYSRGC